MTEIRLRYVCGVCSKSFVTARGFRKHAERTHGEQYPQASSKRKWVTV